MAAAPNIIPKPQLLRVTPGEFAIRAGAGWTVHQPGGETRLVSALKEIQPAGAFETAAREDGWTVIRTGSPAQGAGDRNAAWARNAEGYRLVVDRNGIEIRSRTARGAYYGIQTLAQVLRKNRCPLMVVEDWPALRFRGAHFFPSGPGAALQRKLIARVLGRYKLNRAVIECEAARWDSCPEIAAPESISKAELRELVRLCRRHFIEPIPLINIPGHAKWLFRNDRNLELAEDPKTRWAYCVRHPEGEKLVKQILAEALAVFRPAALHLGHDEVTLGGPFPHPDCPRCAGRTTTELVMDHARRFSEWLRARKVQPLFWGDMLLAKGEASDGAHAPNPQEAAARRAALPRGAVVADWHYGVGNGFPSLKLFHQAGFKTIACTWYEPRNIEGFARAAVRERSQGLLQTTWAGYFPHESVLSGKEARQFHAFVLAAEYAWSARPESPGQLPYRAAEVFRRAYGRE